MDQPSSPPKLYVIEGSYCSGHEVRAANLAENLRLLGRRVALFSRPNSQEPDPSPTDFYQPRRLASEGVRARAMSEDEALGYLFAFSRFACQTVAGLLDDRFDVVTDTSWPSLVASFGYAYGHSPQFLTKIAEEAMGPMSRPDKHVIIDTSYGEAMRRARRRHGYLSMQRLEAVGSNHYELIRQGFRDLARLQQTPILNGRLRPSRELHQEVLEYMLGGFSLEAEDSR